MTRSGSPPGSIDRARVVAADKRYVWHPYTPMRRWVDETEPFVFVRAEGARLWDADGSSYLDGNSSWWVATLGHGHPRLVTALAEQAKRFCHVPLAGATHEPAALLAEELVAAAPPGLARVFYSDDGSTAVEVAMKIALQRAVLLGRPAKKRFVALDSAFHGETLGATSLGGVELFRRAFAGVLVECVHLPVPELGEPAEGPEARAFAAVEQLLREGADTIAALVVEPRVQGAAGMRIHDAAYLRRVRALCDELDVLLVADEVFTGFGRTGPMWACDTAAVTPDILCLAKGLSGGMLPFAATLVSQHVFEPFLAGPEATLYYGHSYCGNPLGAAVAREVLRIFRDDDVIAAARPRAEAISRAFADLATLPGVARTRSLGMIGAADLGRTEGYLGGLGWRAFEEARRLGVYLRPLGDTVYVAPPLTIGDDELDELLAVVRRAVAYALGA